MDRIVYLDIEGVMCTKEEAREVSSFKWVQINPACADELRAIVRIAEAKIRVTSPWRYKCTAAEIVDKFKACRVDVSVVKPRADKDRAQEIRDDIKFNSFKNYLVVDDGLGRDLKEFKDKLLLTDPLWGIDSKTTRSICERLCSFL